MSVPGVDEGAPSLAEARVAFGRHAWAEARAAFLSLRARGPLAAHDMEALAEASWWEGALDESLSASEEAYRLYLHGAAPAPARAAIQAVEIGFAWFLRGESAMGSGWLSRAQRLLDGAPDCVEQAYLEAMGIEVATGEARYDEAVELARRVAATAQRFGDETLGAYALVGEGAARVKQGRVKEGLSILDEAMVSVAAGRVRPAYAGNIYCQLMSLCHELSDLRRAQQWTDATARWCEGFSNAVMYLGICRVHRAQLLQVRGRWAEAEGEIRRVCDDLGGMNVVAVGLAQYELGEVRRLRGDLDAAEVAFAEAHRYGRDPQPGLALLRSAQGRHREALDALWAAENATEDRLGRTRIWAALVEVALAAGDAAVARAACEQLEAAADTFASSGLVAAALLARGQTAVLEEEWAAAQRALGAAQRCWQDLDAPMKLAQTRRLLGDVHRQIGNHEAADLEYAAVAVLAERLDLPNVERAAPTPRAQLHGITPRQAEVLALVAQGLSNREVAKRLVLSEKTVARHLANLYMTIGVTSRTAAAGWAYAHGLAAPPSA